MLLSHNLTKIEIYHFSINKENILLEETIPKIIDKVYGNPHK